MGSLKPRLSRRQYLFKSQSDRIQRQCWRREEEAGRKESKLIYYPHAHVDVTFSWKISLAAPPKF